METLEMLYGTPAGKFVARKLGLSEPPRLRRARTLPTGPVERTITYHAPFDRCDREQDYATVWAEFTRRLH